MNMFVDTHEKKAKLNWKQAMITLKAERAEAIDAMRETIVNSVEEEQFYKDINKIDRELRRLQAEPYFE